MQNRIQPFRLAQTGEGIKECELVQWFVKEGDMIDSFERVCEVQSDKATLEITSSFGGRVVKLHHAVGAVVQVGEPLVDIEAEGDAGSDTCDGGTAGGSDLAEASHAAGAAAPLSPTAVSPADGSSRVRTSPAVRRLLREHGLEAGSVAATGREGRLTKGDVVAHLDRSVPQGTAMRTFAPGETGLVTPAAAQAGGVHAPVVPDFSRTFGGRFEEGEAPGPETVPLRGFRKAMVRSMTAAASVPHFHFCEEVSMDSLMMLRSQVRDDPAVQGQKLTFMPFFIKAASLALEAFPLVNSSLAPDGQSVLQHRTINVGVAVATPHGLAVPNIKHVERLSILEIAAEMSRLHDAALRNALKPADVQGGTFTLSNIGTVGGTYATPLVNGAEVAIMALGRVSAQPRFAPGSDAVQRAHLLNVSLGADHRVVDGAMLAGFAQAWRRFVEQPGRMLLQLR